MPAMNQLLREGRYRIDHQFASNGTSAVYDAYDTVRNTNVLVKEINVRLNRVMTSSQQEQLKLAFANQARALTEIKHEALLHLHDFFSEIDRQYLVLEAIEGQELSDVIETRDVRYSLTDMLGWADQILDGLSYLHRFNPAIIHKNIKPDHIKLTAENKVKLLAFGLADGSDTKISTNIVADLSKQEICYSPLEQIWGDLDAASQKVITNSYDERSEKSLLEPLDSRSDIYSFGATFYHLLTGRKPVDALERSIEMLDGKHDPLTPPHELKASIPPEVSDVIMKSMEVRREDRFDSAAILRQILRTAMIRAKEREDIEEVDEEREAAEAIRVAGQTRNLKGLNPLDKHNPFEERNAQAAAETEYEIETTASPNIHVSQDALRAAVLEQKLREAEEQRFLAEQKAAEIERLLREKEAMTSSPSITIDDNLLDLGTASNPNIRNFNATGKLPKVGTFAFEKNFGKEQSPAETELNAGTLLNEPQIVNEPTPLELDSVEEVVVAAAAFDNDADLHKTSESKYDPFEAERFINSQADLETFEAGLAESNTAPTEVYNTVSEETVDEQVAAERAMYAQGAQDVTDSNATTDQAVETRDEFLGVETADGETYQSEYSTSYYDDPPARTTALPMPLMIGGAAVLFLVIIGVIYSMLPGSTSNAVNEEADVPKQMIEELRSNQPNEPAANTSTAEAPAAFVPANEPPKEVQTAQQDQEPNVTTVSQQTVATEDSTSRRPAAQPTPARTRRAADTPTRQPTPARRAVTVDDLIRDN